MNLEAAPDAPVRRTSRARKVNSKYFGDDIDEGYKKLVDRITASDSSRKKKPIILTQKLESSLNNSSPCDEFDENSNVDDDRDLTQPKSNIHVPSLKRVVLASGIHSPEVLSVVSSPHDQNDKEKYDFLASQIVKYRSSTDTDSEDESRIADPIERELMRLNEGLLAEHRKVTGMPLESLKGIPCPSTPNLENNQPKIFPNAKNSRDTVGQKIKIVSLKPISPQPSLKLSSPNTSPRILSSPTPSNSNVSKLNPFTSDSEDDLSLNTFVKKAELLNFDDNFTYVRKSGESLVAKILKNDAMMKKNKKAAKISKVNPKVNDSSIKKNKVTKSKKSNLPKKQMVKKNTNLDNSQISLNASNSSEEQDNVPLKLLMKKDTNNATNEVSTNSTSSTLEGIKSSKFNELDNEQDELPLLKLFQLDAGKDTGPSPSLESKSTQKSKLRKQVSHSLASSKNNDGEFDNPKAIQESSKELSATLKKRSVKKKRFRGLDSGPKKNGGKLKLSPGFYSRKKLNKSSLESESRFVKIKENGQEYVVLQNFEGDSSNLSESSILPGEKSQITKCPSKVTKQKNEKSLSTSLKKKKRFRSLDTHESAIHNTEAPKDIPSIIPGSKLVSLSSLVLEIPLKDESGFQSETQQGESTPATKNPSHLKGSPPKMAEKEKGQRNSDDCAKALKTKSPPKIKIKVKRHSRTKLNSLESSTHDSTNKIDQSFEIHSEQPDILKEEQYEISPNSSPWINESQQEAPIEKDLAATEEIIGSGDSKLDIEQKELTSKTPEKHLKSPERKISYSLSKGSKDILFQLETPTSKDKLRHESKDRDPKKHSDSNESLKEKASLSDTPSRHSKDFSLNKEKRIDSLPKVKNILDPKDKTSLTGTKSQIESPTKKKYMSDSRDKLLRRESKDKDCDSLNPNESKRKEDPLKLKDVESHKGETKEDPLLKAKPKDSLKLKFEQSLFLRDLEEKDKDKNYFIKKRRNINKDKPKDPDNKDGARQSISKSPKEKFQVTLDGPSPDSKGNLKSSSKERSHDSKKDCHEDKHENSKRDKHRDLSSRHHYHHSSNSRERRRDSKDRHHDHRSRDRKEESGKKCHTEDRHYRDDSHSRDRKGESRLRDRDGNRERSHKNKHRGKEGSLDEDDSHIPSPNKVLTKDNSLIDEFLPPSKLDASRNNHKESDLNTETEIIPDQKPEVPLIKETSPKIDVSKLLVPNSQDDSSHNSLKLEEAQDFHDRSSPTVPESTPSNQNDVILDGHDSSRETKLETTVKCEVKDIKPHQKEKIDQNVELKMTNAQSSDTLKDEGLSKPEAVEQLQQSDNENKVLLPFKEEKLSSEDTFGIHIQSSNSVDVIKAKSDVSEEITINKKFSKANFVSTPSNKSSKAHLKPKPESIPSFGLGSLLKRMREVPKEEKQQENEHMESSSFNVELDKIPLPDIPSDSSNAAKSSHSSDLKSQKELEEIFKDPISSPSSTKASPQKFMTMIYKENLDYVYSLSTKEFSSSNEGNFVDEIDETSEPDDKTNIGGLKLEENDDAKSKLNKSESIQPRLLRSRSSRSSSDSLNSIDIKSKPESRRKSDSNSSESCKKGRKRDVEKENDPSSKKIHLDTQIESDAHQPLKLIDKDAEKPDESPTSISSPLLDKENKTVKSSGFSGKQKISPSQYLENDKENLSPIPSEANKTMENIVVEKKELTPMEHEEIEKKNAQIVAERMKSFELLEENLYLFEKKKCKRSKEVRRLLCDCSLTKEEIANGEMGCGEDCLNRMLLIECGSRCPLKDHCSNRRFQEKNNAKIEVFNAEYKGCGVRACEDIPAGTFIMEYIGEVFDSKEFKRRKKEYAKESSSHFYFMALRSDQLIDATRKGNISRFVNHSCDPNSETQKWIVNGELRIGFFSTRFIPVGEEINFDYRLERYGREPQKCYCGTSFCRGWLGEAPDEKTKEEKEEDRKKELKDKKRRERRLELEDMDLEEEIEKLNESGLRNRQDTLDLSRLMVRAEESKARMSLLHLLKTGEPACRRLFLDYHGLKILWSWMADLGSSSKNITLKLEILQTLECLPITNKTQLTDSRVLNMVERWSKQSPEGKTSPLKMLDSNIQKEEEKAVSSKKASDTSEDSDTEEAESSETPSPDESSQDASESSNKNSPDEENKEEPASPSLGDVINFALKLLPVWTSLSEAFKIPKKERIEMMKEHEREVDRGYREYLAREKKSDKDRYEGWGTSKDRSREKRRDRRRNERNQREDDEDKFLTKEERREKFEKLVAKQDEERLMKLQQEMWALHLQRCSLLGHDPYLTPIFDPTGQYYWDPNVLSWQPYVGPDPNLPVPANYGVDPSMKSPHDIIKEQHQFITGAFYPLPYPPLPTDGEPSTPSDTMDLASIPLPGEVPHEPSSVASPSGNLLTIPLPGEGADLFNDMGNAHPVPQPGSVTIHLPPKWKLARNLDGYLYFYHTKTRVSQWMVPSPNQHKELLIQFGLSSYSDSDSDSESSSSSSSDSEYFSSEEEKEEEEEEITVVRTSDGSCEKMVRSLRGKRKRSEKLVQERVISPILFEDREAARRERREAKVRAREEARNERWQIYKNLKEKQKLARNIPKKEKQSKSMNLLRQEDDGAIDSPKDDDDNFEIQLKKAAKRQKLNEGRTHSKGKSRSKERMVTAMADNSERARKIKDTFRSKMATYIVSVLNPYRKSDCKSGRIVNTEDFKYLARKLTHFVMVKELKQLPSIEGLDCSESVKHKTKEFVRKYMGKYGEEFKRDPNDTKEY